MFYRGTEVAQTDLVHLKAFSVPGRLAGISPLRAFASLWDLGHGARDFAAEFFRKGGMPPAVFTNTAEEVDESQSTEIRRRLTDAIRQHEPLVIGHDWEFTGLSIPADERMFVESRQLSSTEIAAVYGVAPWRVGGSKGSSLTYSSQLSDAVDELRCTASGVLGVEDGHLDR